MFLLDDNLMEREEKELRKLLPISALLHNCLVLALSKVTIDHSLIKRQISTFLRMTSQDGIVREFWKFGGILVCLDKSEINMDKLLVFSRPSEEEGEGGVLKKELCRSELFFHQIFEIIWNFAVGLERKVFKSGFCWQLPPL